MGCSVFDDFFCHDDTWRLTVTRLAREADAVVMDLRGFTSANQGCIFEIEHLAVAVPLQRVVLLVDKSTDVAFLKQVLRRAWSTLHELPIAAAAGHSLRILQASPGQRTLDVLLDFLREFRSRKHAQRRCLERWLIRPACRAGRIRRRSHLHIAPSFIRSPRRLVRA